MKQEGKGRMKSRYGLLKGWFVGLVVNLRYPNDGGGISNYGTNRKE